jgi:ATP-dependent Clp protease ATP-binding subunit ClpA
MADKDPRADGLDIAIGWLQKSIDELSDVTRRVQQVAPTRTSTGAPPAAKAAPSALPPSSAVQASSSALPASSSGQPLPSAGQPSPSAAPASTTALLDRIGRDLTALARQGLLAPVVGREEETAWVIETLLRDTKRNPVLLGPPGVGKTAIVEGLAQRIVAGKVPDALKNSRIIEIPLAGLVAGTQYRGQLEERIQQLVAEASQPGIVLFLDEIHMLEAGDAGLAAALKPALARGDVAVIGATSADEYRTTIARDDSLDRRLSTFEVSELDTAATLLILQALRDRLATSRGVTVSDDALKALLEFADHSIVNRRLPDKAIDLVEQAVARAIVDGRKTVEKDDAVATTQAWAKRASSTPTLERFGRDLTRLARDGRLGPIVGRDREIGAIIEILLRKTKRDPLLLGPAGAGKTAIVEGLAIRLVSGNIPPALTDVRLFDVALLPLAEAISADATLLRDFLAEARHPSVSVFFDEIHLLAAPNVHDLAQALKPALARGEIACIGATTGEEYQANLEPDAALARRFTQVAVEPMDPSTVRIVLASVRNSLAKARGVKMSDDVLDEAIALADQFLPNRAFPDKGVDIIEQSIAHALANGDKTVTVGDMRASVESLVGMPLDPSDRLAALTRELRGRGLLAPAATDALLQRLGVSLRGLDSNYELPDAVCLLWNGAAGSADELADVVARTLFGRSTSVIDIDLAGLTEDQSISTLLGSAPGLVGSDRALPLHALRRAPWQVVLLRGIDRCAVSIRDTITQALQQGSFTDAMGRRLPLGAAVVLMTAPAVERAELLEPVLGKALIAACTVVSGDIGGVSDSGRAAWIRREVLEPLAGRFARQGYALTFHKAFVTWVDSNAPADDGLSEFVDNSVAAPLAAALPRRRGPLTVSIVDGRPAFILPK